MGSTLRCPNTCQVQTVGPNGASALDGVASILAHEIAETITDPNTDAWCAAPPRSSQTPYADAVCADSPVSAAVSADSGQPHAHVSPAALDACGALLASVARRATARAQHTAVLCAAYRARD